MRHSRLLIAGTIAAFAAISHVPHYASADATCYTLGQPTPIPGGVAMVTVPACVHNAVLVMPVDANGSPAPIAAVPTPPYPVTLPTSYQTAFPTPIPFPATQTVIQGTSPWVVTTTSPFSGLVTQGTSPWVVNTPPPFNGVVSGSVSVSNFPATQPVSGTVSATQGTSPWVVNTPPPFSGVVTQGTSPWVVNTPVPYPTAAITNVLKVDGSAVTQPVSGTLTVNTPPPFSGVVTQGTSPWVVNTPPPFSGVISGTVTANAGTGFPTPIPYPTAAITLTLKVDGSSVTQPVSGTLTVNTPPPFSGIVTQATGTNLHTVVDSGAITVNTPPPFSGIVTQATAANLNATVVGTVTANQGTSPWAVTTPPPTTTVTVTQATGTNLHAVLDTTSTTAVTQATSANLHDTNTTDQTTPGTTDLVHSKVCDSTTPANCAKVSGAGGLLSVGAFLAGAGTLSQAIACDNSVVINIASAATTELVLVSGSKAIYVCGFVVDKSSGVATTFQFEYGTKTTTACDTGATVLTGAMDGASQFVTVGNGLGTIFRTPASKELCIVTAGVINIQGVLTYAQF